MKISIAIAAIFVAALLVVASGQRTPVAAQSDPTNFGKPQVAAGANPGEVVVTWTPVDSAKFYRIGWISSKDYAEARASNRDWREAFISVSIANNGQNSYTVTSLIPGDAYWFIVGGSAKRYSEPQWSPWSDLIRLSGGPAACAGDRAALEALYRSTNGDNWQSKLNWLTDAPIGTWFGVSTDSDGCVTVLYVDNNNLSGTLPAELGDLTRLETLDLDGNRISGPIPTEIGNLTNLTVLSLDHNRLSGPIPNYN